MNYEQQKNDLAAQLASALLRTAGAQQPCYLLATDFDLFGLENVPRVKTPENLNPEIDWLACSLPLGMQGGLSKGMPVSWVRLLDAIEAAQPNQCLVVFEVTVISTLKGNRFREQLEALGYCLKAVFGLPGGSYAGTGIPTYLLVIEPGEDRDLFAARVTEDSDLRGLVEGLQSNHSFGSVDLGQRVETEEFRGLTALHASLQIEKLMAGYGGWKLRRFEDLVERMTIGSRSREFEDASNALYLPKITGSTPRFDLDNLPGRQDGYYQLVLNPNLVLSEYLALLLGTPLGLMIRHSVSAGLTIERIDRKQILQAELPIPELGIQKLFVETRHKMIDLIDAINEFDMELSLNPQSVTSVQETLDNTLAALGSLSAADHVRSLIRTGESKTIEFKETLSVDMREPQKKAKHLETGVFKTIGAFLNSEGGTLLVGVADDGTVPGLGPDLRQFHRDDRDNFLKYFKDKLKSRVGESFYLHIRQRLVEIEGVVVLMVECDPADHECYIDATDFYVRTNPATDKLEGPKLVQYVKSRFPSS